MARFPKWTRPKWTGQCAIAALVGVGAMIATSTPASAYVVCNRYGDCWHVREHVDYPRGLRVRYYGDRWQHHHWRHRNWRDEHEGRGYWRHGVWTTF